ncbi:MAG: DUF4139 domain-containing protein [Solobacterium sp.]|nr:DUF4139 domain-containing protein [Solobacterium sp.]
MSQSIIKEVSVYRQGAYVSRQGKISLKKGQQTLVLDSLPNTIIPSTVVLSLTENIKGSNVQVHLLDEEIRKEQLKEEKRKLDELNHSITVKEAQIELWNKNGDFSGGKDINIAQMSEYIEKLPERLNTLYSELLNLNEEKEKIEKEYNDKKDAVNSLQVSATIEANDDGEYAYQLRYFEQNASWIPLYEIHSSTDKNLVLRMKANIRQFTSEDWKNVSIKLYSGNPRISLDLPELDPTYLSYRASQSPKPMKKYAGSVLAEKAMMNMIMEEEVSDSFEDVYADAGTVNQDDTMMEYVLSGTWDVSKTNETLADIYSKEIPCNYHVIAIPRLETNGYLAAQVNVEDISDVLESYAKIYHNQTLLGELYIDVDTSEEKMDISLGRDETIQLKREQKKKYTSSALLKNQKTTDYVYELTVSSSKNKPCDVTVYDQIPVSREKDIIVERKNLSNGKLDEATGKITWDFNLDSGKDTKLSLEYSVSWPKDKEINN